MTMNGTHRRTRDSIKKASAKPPRVEVKVENIPAEVAGLERWCCWRWEWREKKSGTGSWTKPPINPRDGRGAKSNDPSTWVTLGEALAFVADGKADGIGFMLGDGWAGVDLDDCVDPDTGIIDPWATIFIRHVDTYTERSPSGTGIKMLVRGELPIGKRKIGAVEFYDSVRYFTITGQRVEGTPADVQERKAAVARLHAEVVLQDLQGKKKERDEKRQAKGKNRLKAVVSADDEHQDDGQTDHGDDWSFLQQRARYDPKLARLLAGDTSGYDSNSEADSALCCKLAYYLGRDARRVDATFRQSKLMRDKWGAAR